MGHSPACLAALLCICITNAAVLRKGGSNVMGRFPNVIIIQAYNRPPPTTPAPVIATKAPATLLGPQANRYNPLRQYLLSETLELPANAQSNRYVDNIIAQLYGTAPTSQNTAPAPATNPNARMDPFMASFLADVDFPMHLPHMHSPSALGL